mgnify:CR=1 FL=1
MPSESLVVVCVSGGARLRVTQSVLKALLESGAVYTDADENYCATNAIAVIGKPGEEETLLQKTKTADFFEPHLSSDVLAVRVNDFWDLLNSRARELAGDYPFGEKPTAWDLLHAITASLEGTDSACEFWRQIAQGLSYLENVDPWKAEPGLYWGRDRGHSYHLFIRTSDGQLYRLLDGLYWEPYTQTADAGLYFRGPLRHPGRIAKWVKEESDKHLGVKPTEEVIDGEDTGGGTGGDDHPQREPGPADSGLHAG